jgi:hypothetical protein
MKELLEMEFSKELLLVKGGSLKAIISFTNPSMLNEFLVASSQLEWLRNVLKVDSEYFKDGYIDFEEKYLDTSDDKFYEELKSADVFIIS